MRGLDEILESAADDQIRDWHKALLDDSWPESMPVPREAAEAVWHAVTKRFMNLPLPTKQTKKEKKA